MAGRIMAGRARHHDAPCVRPQIELASDQTAPIRPSHQAQVFSESMPKPAASEITAPIDQLIPDRKALAPNLPAPNNAPTGPAMEPKPSRKQPHWHVAYLAVSYVWLRANAERDLLRMHLTELRQLSCPSARFASGIRRPNGDIVPATLDSAQHAEMLVEPLRTESG